jgi:hypothetical protein
MKRNIVGQNIMQLIVVLPKFISNENSSSLEFYFVTLMVYCLKDREILVIHFGREVMPCWGWVEV